MKVIGNYINGEIVEPVSKSYIDNVEPATGKVYGKIPDSGSEDVDRAVEAAQGAFQLWSELSEKARSEYLERIAYLIESKMEELARAESVDNGKPISLARDVDIPRAVENFRFFATAILHFYSEAHHTGSEALNYTNRIPIGVAGCISPWNLPLYLFTWKIAPALAVGNCVVAKPSNGSPTFILLTFSTNASRNLS